MHLNQGRFMQNGRTGYVLQPAFMRNNEGYDPYDSATLKDIVEPIMLSVTVWRPFLSWLIFFLLRIEDLMKFYRLFIQIVAGRHFVKAGKGIASPFVEVEVTGADYDCSKYKTETVRKYELDWFIDCFVSF